MSSTSTTLDRREIRHFHLFLGLGGGARGFNRASVKIANMEGVYRCIGGIDNDPAACRDAERLAGMKASCLDLFDREQYVAFHGHEPGHGWREATPADIQKAAGGERPHIVFLSAPCKGFSGLLSESKSKTDKYQALNRLTIRGVWLMLEAWAADPPEMVVFENVPRIAIRGRKLLDAIAGLLRSYGYATRETTHDCGELGGLAQSRKRFLLVARHAEKVPPFLYEPPKRALRAVGDVLGRMPLPGSPASGVMHRVPSLQWKTWVRLAFVEAGKDWRSLNRLSVVDGQLRDYLLVPEMRHGVLGVRKWDEPTGTVAGNTAPSNGAFSVADPRYPAGGDYGQLGVRRWNESTGAITGQRSPIQGGFSVADPRHAGPDKMSNEFRVVPWERQSQAITSAHATGQCVADPRPDNNRKFENIYRVTRWDSASRTVIGATAPADGAMSVADPRPAIWGEQRANYQSGGHYGVISWSEPAGAISTARQCHTGPFSVADPRLPEPNARLACRIISGDNTWHRPFTTLELAGLQSLIEPEEFFELDGLSDQAWRERIGNAVPPDAAQAIAETMGRTLLLAWAGESFQLSAVPIWVRPIAIALTLPSTGDVA